MRLPPLQIMIERLLSSYAERTDRLHEEIWSRLDTVLRRFGRVMG